MNNLFSNINACGRGIAHVLSESSQAVCLVSGHAYKLLHSALSHVPYQPGMPYVIVAAVNVLGIGIFEVAYRYLEGDKKLDQQNYKVTVVGTLTTFALGLGTSRALGVRIRYDHLALIGALSIVVYQAVKELFGGPDKVKESSHSSQNNEIEKKVKKHPSKEEKVSNGKDEKVKKGEEEKVSNSKKEKVKEDEEAGDDEGEAEGDKSSSASSSARSKEKTQSVHNSAEGEGTDKTGKKDAPERKGSHSSHASDREDEVENGEGEDGELENPDVERSDTSSTEENSEGSSREASPTRKGGKGALKVSSEEEEESSEEVDEKAAYKTLEPEVVGIDDKHDGTDELKTAEEISDESSSEDDVALGGKVEAEDKDLKGAEVPVEAKDSKGADVPEEDKDSKGAEVPVEAKDSKGADVSEEDKDPKGAKVPEEAIVLADTNNSKKAHASKKVRSFKEVPAPGALKAKDSSAKTDEPKVAPAPIGEKITTTKKLPRPPEGSPSRKPLSAKKEDGKRDRDELIGSEFVIIPVDKSAKGDPSEPMDTASTTTSAAVKTDNGSPTEIVAPVLTRKEMRRIRTENRMNSAEVVKKERARRNVTEALGTK